MIPRIEFSGALRYKCIHFTEMTGNAIDPIQAFSKNTTKNCGNIYFHEEQKIIEQFFVTQLYGPCAALSGMPAFAIWGQHKPEGRLHC